LKNGLTETKEELLALVNGPDLPSDQKDKFKTVHLSCKLCMYIYTDKCTGASCPEQCDNYKLNPNKSDADKLTDLIEDLERALNG